MKINIDNDTTDKILTQLWKDAHFLEDQNTNDYSLLIGIHKKENDEVQRYDTPDPNEASNNSP